MQKGNTAAKIMAWTLISHLDLRSKLRVKKALLE